MLGVVFFRQKMELVLESRSRVLDSTRFRRNCMLDLGVVTYLYSLSKGLVQIVPYLQQSLSRSINKYGQNLQPCSDRMEQDIQIKWAGGRVRLNKATNH